MDSAKNKPATHRVFSTFSFLIVLAVLHFSFIDQPLSNVDLFRQKLTKEARALFDSLDDAHKRKAIEISVHMSNPNQAVFLSAQDSLSHPQGQISPPENLNQINPKPVEKMQSPPTENKGYRQEYEQNFQNHELPQGQPYLPNQTRP